MTITMQLKDYWDKRAKRFGAKGRGLKAVCSFGMPWLYNKYIDLIQRKALNHYLHAKKGEAILDIGCGIGRWSLKLAERGAMVTGVDLSQEMINIARERARDKGLPISFIASPIQGLMVEASSFDKALAVTCLQHIISDEEMERSITIISRALKPGGVFILLEVAPDKEIKRCDTEIFKARTRLFYKRVCEAHGLFLEDVRSVDPSPFKRWFIPYYRRLPAGLGRLIITAITIPSFAIDIIFAGAHYLTASSWHKVMIFKKI